jgi:hypothetical protein
MKLGHEKLDVYRLSIGAVAWLFEKDQNLIGVHRPARDLLLRASQSIPLNIAEGNGKMATWTTGGIWKSHAVRRGRSFFKL